MTPTPDQAANSFHTDGTVIETERYALEVSVETLSNRRNILMKIVRFAVVASLLACGACSVNTAPANPTPVTYVQQPAPVSVVQPAPTTTVVVPR